MMKVVLLFFFLKKGGQLDMILGYDSLVLFFFFLLCFISRSFSRLRFNLASFFFCTSGFFS